MKKIILIASLLILSGLSFTSFVFADEKSELEKDKKILQLEQQIIQLQIVTNNCPAMVEIENRAQKIKKLEELLKLKSTESTEKAKSK